jgi:hypothetical protein
MPVHLGIDIEHVDAGKHWPTVSLIYECVERQLTFWIVLVSVLEVLDDAVLTYDILNLSLGVNVERVVIQNLYLLLALALCVLLSTHHVVVFLPPAAWVVEGGEEVWGILAQVRSRCGVVQELLSHILWVWVATSGCLRCCPLRRVPTAADEQHQHLAILDAGIIQCLHLVAQGAAIEVKLLGGGREASVGLYQDFEVFDGDARRRVYAD